MNDTSDSDYLTIARISKVWGRRGEVAAHILTDFPERFQQGGEVLLLRSGVRETLDLESVFFHKGRANLKFRGIDSITAAEALIGGEIQIPASDRKPLDAGQVYLSDLVGCTVLEEADGVMPLGNVESVEQTGAAPLLRILTPDGELLIPFAEEICRTVDLGKRQIRVRLPEGLKELNQKRT